MTYDLIDRALTTIGIIAGIAVVVWQLGRQHRSSLLLQRDNAREELKLRLHELLVQGARKLRHANVKAAMYAYMIPFTLENVYNQAALGIRLSPVKQRAPVFSQLHDEAADAFTDLIGEFESWSIAFPGLKVFQVALSAASYEAREAFTPLFTALLRALPIDPPEDAPPSVPRPLVPSPLSGDELTKLRGLVERYKEAMDVIVNYVDDLTIESQNNLLSGLFERRLAVRQPIDPRYRVISTDPAQGASSPLL